jgi:hypothetical protein
MTIGNLIAEDGRAQEVRVAAMTASGFSFTGVTPALGRTLIEQDERPGVPPVGVIASRNGSASSRATPRSWSARSASTIWCTPSSA